MQIATTEEPARPVYRTLPDAYKTIERAVIASQVAAKSTRYGYLLRVLPDWIVEGVCNAIKGDENAAATLLYLTMRVGGILHGKKHKTFDPKDEELKTVAQKVLRDCARERLRRMGVLTKFEPAPDPFAAAGATNRARIEVSTAAKAWEGEAAQYLAALCSEPAALHKAESLEIAQEVAADV